MALAERSIAFIGLGVMGFGMAINLRKKMKANVPLIVSDVNQDAIERFQLQTKDMGLVQVAANAFEALKAADTIITMLPSDAAVELVYLDPQNGLFAAAQRADKNSARTKKLLMECGTVSQATVSKISEESSKYNVTFIDAPVSGGPMGSLAGTLSFMVGCDEELFHPVHSLLSLMGKEDSIFRCGTVGSGTAFKIINNYISIISILSVSEAMHIANKMGLDIPLLSDLINKSSGQCWVSSNNHPVPGIHPNAPASHEYQGGFRIELAEKVLDLGRAMAEDVGARTFLDKAALEVFAKVASDGKYAGRDARVVYRFLNDISEQ